MNLDDYRSPIVVIVDHLGNQHEVPIYQVSEFMAKLQPKMKRHSQAMQELKHRLKTYPKEVIKYGFEHHQIFPGEVLTTSQINKLIKTMDDDFVELEMAQRRKGHGVGCYCTACCY